MAVKITVNGVAYDSVDAMPPDVRQVYQQSLARVPELADRDGDGIPDIVEGVGLPLHQGTTVRSRIVVNGTTYDSLKAMPPDVRESYERAMQAMSTGGPEVTRDEIKLAFRFGGAGFSFQKAFGMPTAPPPIRGSAATDSTSQPGVNLPTPRPIEPGPAGNSVRLAIFLVACAAGGLMIWLLMRGR